MLNALALCVSQLLFGGVYAWRVFSLVGCSTILRSVCITDYITFCMPVYVVVFFSFYSLQSALCSYCVVRYCCTHRLRISLSQTVRIKSGYALCCAVLCAKAWDPSHRGSLLLLFLLLSFCCYSSGRAAVSGKNIRSHSNNNTNGKNAFNVVNERETKGSHSLSLYAYILLLLLVLLLPLPPMLAFRAQSVWFVNWNI